MRTYFFCTLGFFWLKISATVVTASQYGYGSCKRGPFVPSFRNRRGANPGTNSNTNSIRLVSRRKYKEKQSKVGEMTVNQQQAENGSAPLTWNDLGPAAKAVAGTVQVGAIFGMEYVQGFVGGYFLGSVTGIPSLLFKNAGASTGGPLGSEMGLRFTRMNAKSVKWAKSWAPISAIFGGFSAATRVARGGVEDEWNSVISSAAAGAYFSKEGMYLFYTCLDSCNERERSVTYTIRTILNILVLASCLFFLFYVCVVPFQLHVSAPIIICVQAVQSPCCAEQQCMEVSLTFFRGVVWDKRSWSLPRKWNFNLIGNKPASNWRARFV